MQHTAVVTTITRRNQTSESAGSGARTNGIIGLAHSRNMVLEEKDIGLNELGNYREVFLSNSLIGIWPVRSIDEHIYNPGSITRSLQGALEI